MFLQRPTCAYVLSRSSRVQLFATLETVARQAPLSIGLASKNTGVGWLPFPPPGDLPDPGIKPASPALPALQTDSLQLNHGREAHGITSKCSRIKALFVGLGVDVGERAE